MSDLSGPWPRRSYLTVSELTVRVRETLEANLEDCWVVGEISNFRVPPSGHFYFVLKDEQAQIAAVMFRGTNRSLAFRPEDGLQVFAHGHVSLYEVRGTLQFYVDAMEPCGLGSVHLALEQLKQRLAAEGLFAEERKRPLPFLPRRIGIITSIGGAAIQDMLVVLRQRMPAVNVVLRPVTVQGKEAPAEIVCALQDLQSVPDLDVIIVGRGGGSREDLWAFNDEAVARAIAGSAVPVVSAVGHEIDFTIADLVADRRAPTPTAAATIVVPSRHDLLAQIDRQRRLLTSAFRRILGLHRERLSHLARRLRDPRHTIENYRLRLDELGERAVIAIGRILGEKRLRIRALAEQLHALSPLAVLDRGFALATRADSGAIVRDATTLAPGDLLRLRFARGTSSVRVETVEPGANRT
jgi:exodeoxyribonuclease VII large subunit